MENKRPYRNHLTPKMEGPGMWWILMLMDGPLAKTKWGKSSSRVGTWGNRRKSWGSHSKIPDWFMEITRALVSHFYTYNDFIWQWFLHFWCIEIYRTKQIILAKRQGSNHPFDLTPHAFIISPSLELANSEHAHEASLELWTFSAGFTWDALCKGYKVGPKNQL